MKLSNIKQPLNEMEFNPTDLPPHIIDALKDDMSELLQNSNGKVSLEDAAKEVIINADLPGIDNDEMVAKAAAVLLKTSK